MMIDFVSFFPHLVNYGSTVYHMPKDRKKNVETCAALSTKNAEILFLVLRRSDNVSATHHRKSNWNYLRRVFHAEQGKASGSIISILIYDFFKL